MTTSNLSFNLLHIIVFLLVGSFSGQCQVSIQDSKMTWFGLDFSESRMIGSEGFADPDDIVERFFNKWNKLLKNESEKYSFEKYFKKKEVIYDLTNAKTRNDLVNAETLVIDEEYILPRENIDAIVKTYAGKTSGLGLLFVVEAFNKEINKGSFWVTFFDASSGEILKTKLMQGKSGGFGLRNYWASSILRVMKDAKKKFKLKK